jgi:uncharacterized protein (DUF3084 family)
VILEEARSRLAEAEEREGGLDVREAVLATREEVLTTLEKTAAAREKDANSKLQELEWRGEELAHHECGLALREGELSTECEHLEMLEHQVDEGQRVLVDGQAALDDHVKKTTAQLEWKETAVREESARKLAAELERLREEWRGRRSSMRSALPQSRRTPTRKS